MCRGIRLKAEYFKPSTSQFLRSKPKVQNRIRVSTLKKAAIAVVSASALALAACGSDDGSATAGSSTKADAKTSAATSAAAMESAAETAPSGEPAPADAPSELPENVEVPTLPVAEHAPVEGEPANPEDAAAIDQLVRGIDSNTTLRAYMAYIPNNTCQRVLDENGGAIDLAQIPDLPLDQYAEFQQAKPAVNEITDIRTNGDTASAQVTATSDGETSTDTMRFQREGGRWTFCN